MTGDPARNTTGEDGTGTMRVRAAVPDDARELYELSVRAIRESAADHYSGPELEAWAARRSVESHRVLVERTRTFVVDDGSGAAAGFLSLLSVPGHPDAEVDQLFVDPRVGGRGVARLLLDTAEGAARRAGHRRIRTHASWRAVPAFERHGYRQVRTETVRLGEETLTRALMDKPLGAEVP